MEQNQTPGGGKAATQTSAKMDDIKAFYKESLPKIFKAIFLEPVTGAYEIFSVRTEKSYQHSLLLIATTGVLFILLPYLAVGELREFFGFKMFLMMGIGAAVALLLIAAFSFGIKSLFGKSNFKNELLTGGICGIPLSLFIVISFVLSLFSKDLAGSMIESPTTLLGGGWFVTLLVLYCLLSMINIFQQSLRSSGTKDNMSWYLSPVSILLSFYLAGKIVSGLL